MTTITEQDLDATLTIDRQTSEGDILGRVALDPAYFGVAPNVALIHQVVVGQLATRRAGTQSTKTRSEVSGGGAKPFRQKGTGRARAGSTRAPNWSGGGVALGPKPRSYRQRTPKKMVQQALRQALSDRANDGRIRLVDEWAFAVPKTKDAAAALAALEVGGRVVVVLEHGDVIAERSFDNLPYVDLVEDTQLTAYDVLCSDWIVFTDATLPGETTVVETYDEPLRREVEAPVAVTPPPKRRVASEPDDEDESEIEDATEVGIDDEGDDLEIDDVEDSVDEGDADDEDDAEDSVDDAEDSVEDADDSVEDDSVDGEDVEEES
jgi:large subunit ribosomal protein L4